MKMIKSTVLIALFAFSAKAQTSVEDNLLNEITTSASNGHYYRAERFIGELKWTLKVQKLSNVEEYKKAYKSIDSLKFYKKNEVLLDKSKAGSVKANAKTDAQLKSLSELIKKGQLTKAIATLESLNIGLSIKSAEESNNKAAVVTRKALLVANEKVNTEQLKSTETSTNYNEFKIDSITKALAKTDSAKSYDTFSVLKQELDLRNKVKTSVDKMHFLSASMDYESLKGFLSDPQPVDRTPKPVFVPTTKNQKEIVKLQKELIYRRKANIHIGTYPLLQQLQMREAMEVEIKKGNKARVEEIEEEIRDLQSGF